MEEESITQRELEAAVILQKLPELLRDSGHLVHYFHSLRWGARKKRSTYTQRAQSGRFPSPSPKPYTLEQRTEVTVAVAAATSPASSLCFYQSGDDDADHCSKPKKAKLQWNHPISSLGEVDRSLEQEGADVKTQFSVMVTENSRRQGLKSELNVDLKTEANHHHHQPRLPHLSTFLVEPIRANSNHHHHHHHHQKQGTLPNISIDQRPKMDQALHYPFTVSTQFWRLGGVYHGSGGGGGSGGVSSSRAYGRSDYVPEGLVKQQRVWEEEKRMAAEARGKRIEIKRRKAAAAAAPVGEVFRPRVRMA